MFEPCVAKTKTPHDATSFADAAIRMRNEKQTQSIQGDKIHSCSTLDSSVEYVL